VIAFSLLTEDTKNQALHPCILDPLAVTGSHAVSSLPSSTVMHTEVCRVVNSAQIAMLASLPCACAWAA
jgi:hypothetical protein